MSDIVEKQSAAVKPNTTQDPRVWRQLFREFRSLVDLVETVRLRIERDAVADVIARNTAAIEGLAESLPARRRRPKPQPRIDAIVDAQATAALRRLGFLDEEGQR